MPVLERFDFKKWLATIVLLLAGWYASIATLWLGFGIGWFLALIVQEKNKPDEWKLNGG